jgi:hypothetical protein
MLGHSIVSQHFMEPVASIPNSQELPTCFYPEPDQSSPHHPIPSLQDPLEVFVTSFFYGEGMLTPLPIPKLEGHPLLSVHDCLFNIFAANLHIWRPFLHPQPEGAHLFTHFLPKKHGLSVPCNIHNIILDTVRHPLSTIIYYVLCYCCKNLYALYVIVNECGWHLYH